MAQAVCLLSGGLDSCVAATIAKNQGNTLFMLTCDYGQRHKKEIESAKKIAEHLKTEDHMILPVPLGNLGGSALTENIPIPEGVEQRTSIPPTYVPARNTIFLSYGLAYAEIVDADSIYIGATCVDYSGYPDCRPEYFYAFQSLADLATKRAIEGHPIMIKTPLLNLSKADIIKKGRKEHAPLHLTWSCYRGGKHACGRCDACLLRLKGFQEAKIKDPVTYENK